MKDSFNREINYLRISVTEECNYACRYCKTEEEAFKTKRLSDNAIINIVKAASDLGVTKVRLTGGEPLLREGLAELIHKIKAVEGIGEIDLTTNGSLLNEYAETLKTAGCDRVNVSLDSLDDVKFKYITRGGNLTDVLDGIDRCYELGMKPVKINTVLMKGINDDEIKDFIDLTKGKDLIVRFIELMPLGTQDFAFDEYYLNNDEILIKHPELKPLPHKRHEPAHYYQVPGYKGQIGLISAVSHFFCGDCNRVRVTSDGSLKTCLFDNTEYDLKPYLNNPTALKNYLLKCIQLKPKSHQINRDNFEEIKRSMYKIGG